MSCKFSNVLARNFNSRPSARGDGSSVLLMDSEKQFQFTPLREGRPSAMGGFTTKSYFNSRPSARGDTLAFQRYEGGQRFQFTPLREGRLRKTHFVPWWFLFQFTPLREGRRGWRQIWRRSTTISIHAPPRGATRVLGQLRRFDVISIHAPPRGATLPTGNYYGERSISIHAPPRGATCLLATLKLCTSYFNSRPSARGDPFPRAS